MKKKIAKKEIDKKVKKICKIASEYVKYCSPKDENLTIIGMIIKTFGSTDYEYDGDSLYHMFTNDQKYPCGGVTLEGLKYIITSLNHMGLDPNVRNKDGQTFFTDSVIERFKNDIDFFLKLPMVFNSQDNKGQTILHKLVNTDISVCNFCECFEKIKDHVDSAIKDNDGKTFLDLVDEETSNMHLFNYELAFLRELRKSYYEKNFSCFIDKLDNDKNEINEYLDLIFSMSEMNAIHYWCHDNEYISEDEKLKAIEKLFVLDIADPNFCKGIRYPIVLGAIYKGYSTEYILKLSKLCLEHGYKVNSEPTIMECCFNNNYSFQRLIDVYVLLSKYGYNNLSEDIFECKLNKKWNYTYNLDLLIRKTGLKQMLNDLLKEKNLIDGTIINFNDAFYNYMLEIERMLEPSLKMTNDYDMVKLLIEKVVQNRENNINIVEENVSMEELYDALNIILEAFISDKAKPMRKILNKYS